MRIRQIKPGFWLNEDLARLSHAARLAWIGLWGIADKSGRLEARPQRIRGQLFPYEPTFPIDLILSEIETAGFLVRYRNDGVEYFEIPNFVKHQRFSGGEAKNDSLLPGPNDSGSSMASVEEAQAASNQEASLASDQEAVNVRSTEYGVRSTEYGSKKRTKRESDPRVEDVLAHVEQTWPRPEGVKFRASQADRKAIAQRLADGFGVEALCRVMDAALKDRFWADKSPASILKDQARCSRLADGQTAIRFADIGPRPGSLAETRRLAEEARMRSER